ERHGPSGAGLAGCTSTRSDRPSVVRLVPMEPHSSPPRMVLETERLELVPVTPGHADALLDAVVASRPELLPWMPWARDPSPEGNRRATEDGERVWRDGRVFHFVVVERATRAVIGVAGLDRADAG